MADETAASPEPRASATIEFQDSVLVDRCRKGDMQAFGLLVAKYQDRVFNLTLRLTGNRSDAEEVSQEAFLKALERISQFRGQSGFYTWLFRIAANLAISQRRRGGRIRFQPLLSGEESDGSRVAGIQAGALSDPRGESPQANLVAAESKRLVLQALEELDDDSRLVVVLRDIEDMDYSQIADVLEVPVGTVKSRLHRARCILKDKLAQLKH